MTPDEQNRAVAEFCKTGPYSDFVGLKKHHGYWWRHEGIGYAELEKDAGRFTRAEAEEIVRRSSGEVQIHEFSIPDYGSDLNAMHEALMALTSGLNCKGFPEFLCHLWAIVNKGTEIEPCHPMNQYSWLMVTASASQQREAYVRAIGKWKEDA